MSELETKSERVVKMLHDEQLDGVLMNTQHNFSWITGGGANGIDFSRENGAGFLFVTKEKRFVIANNIEMQRLLTEEMRGGSLFEPIEISWQSERDPQSILNAARSVAGGNNFGCDIGFPETRWIEPSIASCRFELTPEEIERYRSLGHDAGHAIVQTIARLEPGQTETEIARIVRDELGRLNIYSIVTLVAADERISNYRHPVPTGNVWRNTLLIVVCARRHGLIASLTRMICASEIPDDLQRRTDSCAAVNAALYAATVVGSTASELYRTAADAYEQQGFGAEINKHHQGGAAGYRTRDWVAHPDGGDVVRPNQAFAWNPSITGTKTEETAILTGGGLDVITASDTFPKIVTVIDGKEYHSPGILSLSKGVSA
jgi:Xaa-Pro dipeptidase